MLSWLRFSSNITLTLVFTPALYILWLTEHSFPQLFPFSLISFSFFKIQLCFVNADEAPGQP